MDRHPDLTGHEFGRWPVVKPARNPKNDRAGWWCRCSCGTERFVRTEHLKSGASSSCGCRRGVGPMEQHGLSGLPEYEVWKNMRARCERGGHVSYHRYGGRGIQVCDRWRMSFEAFLDDVGRRPTEDHTLDRIDNDGDYRPGNCRWVTRKEQARSWRGPKNPRSSAKLSEHEVREIRDTSGETTVSLARRYDVVPRTIRDVLSGATWRHL